MDGGCFGEMLKDSRRFPAPLEITLKIIHPFFRFVNDVIPIHYFASLYFEQSLF